MRSRLRFGCSEVFPRLSALLEPNAAVGWRNSHAGFDRRRVNSCYSDLTSYPSGLKTDYSRSFSHFSRLTLNFPGVTSNLCGLISSLCGLTSSLCGVTLNLSGVE